MIDGLSFAPMIVNLVDGTYELFRQFFGQPSHLNNHGEEVGATRGVLTSLVQMLEDGSRYIGVATDHVIESFRNDLFAGYKTGAGIEPTLYSQFPILEEGIEAMGIKVWPTTDLEADDAMASAAVVASEDERVSEVVIMTPDKDMHQCLDGKKIVQFDRKNNRRMGPEEVREKMGVSPESIPDYLALVGDAADGIPGLSGWGPKSSALLLQKFGSLEKIPHDPTQWEIPVRGAVTLAQTLSENMEAAILYKELATLRVDRSVLTNVDELKWQGPTNQWNEFVERIDAERIAERLSLISH